MGSPFHAPLPAHNNTLFSTTSRWPRLGAIPNGLRGPGDEHSFFVRVGIMLMPVVCQKIEW